MLFLLACDTESTILLCTPYVGFVSPEPDFIVLDDARNVRVQVAGTRSAFPSP